MKDFPPTYVDGFHDEESVKRMEYVELGKTGLLISKISMGAATLSNLYGFVTVYQYLYCRSIFPNLIFSFSSLDEDEAIKTVHEAIKKGINFIDTAPWYGQRKSEEVLGRALKDVPRKAYYIASKIGRYEIDVEKMFDFSSKKTRESVEKSLKLLGVESIDLIQVCFGKIQLPFGCTIS